MGLKDIDHRDYVLKAIGEFDALGREAFLTHYGFGPARAYELQHDGKAYDSKAIVGVAHKFARPDLGALKAESFTGGNATVQKLLERLGFMVTVANPFASGNLTSDWLVKWEVYTRDALKLLLETDDATINNGVSSEGD